MKKIIVCLFYLLAVGILFGQDINLNIKKQYGFINSSRLNAVYVNNFFILSIQENTDNYAFGINDVDYSEIKYKIKGLYGNYKDKLFITDFIESDKDYGFKSFKVSRKFLLNINTGEKQPFPFEHVGYLYYLYDDKVVFHYLENQFLIKVYILDMKTGIRQEIKELEHCEILDISDDKRYLLIQSIHDVNKPVGIILYDLVERKFKNVAFTIGLPRSVEYNAHFLTNELFYVETHKEGIWDIYHIDGRKIATIDFIAGTYHAEAIVFSKNLRVGIMEPTSKWELVLVDTTPFLDWLDKKGLLFHKTTGVVTDSDLRVREIPNLEAKVFGTLNKADKVEVLDRSSVKMKIGSLNDYWYKIRIFSDGLEGWCFGGYLEIEGN